MLLISSVLSFLKLSISFCFILSFLFLLSFFFSPFFIARPSLLTFQFFPPPSTPYTSSSASASAAGPSPTIPPSPLSETLAGEPWKLGQPYSSHQPNTNSPRDQNQRERPLKYNHGYNEGAPKNNKHIHQRRNKSRSTKERGRKLQDCWPESVLEKWTTVSIWEKAERYCAERGQRATASGDGSLGHAYIQPRI